MAVAALVRRLPRSRRRRGSTPRRRRPPRRRGPGSRRMPGERVDVALGARPVVVPRSRRRRRCASARRARSRPGRTLGVVRARRDPADVRRPRPRREAPRRRATGARAAPRARASSRRRRRYEERARLACPRRRAPSAGADGDREDVRRPAAPRRSTSLPRRPSPRAPSRGSPPRSAPDGAGRPRRTGVRAARAASRRRARRRGRARPPSRRRTPRLVAAEAGDREDLVIGDAALLQHLRDALGHPGRAGNEERVGVEVSNEVVLEELGVYLAASLPPSPGLAFMVRPSRKSGSVGGGARGSSSRKAVDSRSRFE